MVPVGQVNARLDLVSQCSDDDDDGGGGGADDDGVDGCSDLTANLDFSCLSLLRLTDLEIGHEADFYVRQKKPTCARAEEGGKEERRVDKEDLKRKREGEEKKKKPALAPRWNVSSSSATEAATSSSVDNEMPRKRARDDASGNVPVRQCSSSSSSSNRSNIEKRVKSIARAAAIARRRPRNPNGHLSITGKHSNCNLLLN
ncbi:hypothetical protein Aperf_G00000096058 [Anoplocephala perfoliata]